MLSRVHASLRRKAVIVLAVGLTLGVAGTAAAGSGRYANVQLGVTNAISGYVTTISATVRGNAVQILNASTSSAARALLARNVSSAAALVAQNLGSGPAGSFLVNTSRSTRAAPFTVNSSTRVANLNADKLDGVDSSQFQRSGARGTDTARAGTATATTSSDPALTIAVAGGTFRYHCSTSNALVGWSGPSAEIWIDYGAADPTHFSTIGFSGAVLPNEGARSLYVISSGARVAFLDLYSHDTGTECHYAIQLSEYRP